MCKVTAIFYAIFVLNALIRVNLNQIDSSGSATLFIYGVFYFDCSKNKTVKKKKKTYFLIFRFLRFYAVVKKKHVFFLNLIYILSKNGKGKNIFRIKVL